MIYKSEVLTEVKDLRWFLYSNRAAEGGGSLSSTTGSLQAISYWWSLGTQHLSPAIFETLGSKRIGVMSLTF